MYEVLLMLIMSNDDRKIHGIGVFTALA